MKRIILVLMAALLICGGIAPAAQIELSGDFSLATPVSDLYKYVGGLTQYANSNDPLPRCACDSVMEAFDCSSSFYSATDQGATCYDFSWSLNEHYEARLYNRFAPVPALTVTNSSLIGVNNDFPTYELDVTGTVKATLFQGDGSGLTPISSTSHNHDAIYMKLGGATMTGPLSTTQLAVSGPVKLGTAGTEIKAIQSGTDGLGPGGGGKAAFLITFPTPFGTPPKVMVTVRNSGTYTDVFALSTSEVTTDGFKVTLYRVDNSGGIWGQTPLLDWIAVE